MEMSTRNHKAIRVTIAGMLLNLLLAGMKILAGIFGRSGAIIADAVHSLSDLSTDLAVIFGLKAASKPADKSHDYGHGKVETLTTAFIGLFLLMVGFKILGHGILKIADFLSGTPLARPGWIAVFAASLSVVFKEWLYQKTYAVGKAIHSQTIVANAWHHRSDALSSLGVMLGIFGAIVLGERWHILDPLAAIVVSMFIVKTAIAILRDSLNELMEASLSDDVKEEILALVSSIPGVRSPHNLRTRRIGKTIAVDIHIRVEKTLNVTQAHNIATQVEDKIKSGFGPDTFIYVHVEPADTG